MRKFVFIVAILSATILKGFSQLYPQSLYSATSFATRPFPNANDAVGTLSGNQEVNLNGAATYTIDIDLPAGRKGLTPSVSLVYNSQAGPGLAGYGWNMTGISAITRTGKNFFTNGKIEPAALTTADGWELDGNRLMLKSGTQGAPGAEYGTEMETFTKITAVGSLTATPGGTGPSYFLAVNKDGLSYEYKTVSSGGVNYSVFDKNNVEHGLTYLISKVTDLANNKMEYDYALVNGQIQLTKIRYGLNTSLATAYEVEFKYDKVTTNANVSFQTGIKIEHYVIKEILVKASGVMFKKYQFSYGTELVSPHIPAADAAINPELYLTEIWVAASSLAQPGNFSSLGKTIFLYGENVNKTSDVATTGFPLPNNYDSNEWLHGDFNGDGKSEILYIKHTNDIVNTIGVYRMNGAVATVAAPAFPSWPTGTVYQYDIKVGDYNGDGLDDIALLERVAGLNSIQIYYATAYTGSGSYTCAFNAPVAFGPPFVDNACDFCANDGLSTTLKGRESLQVGDFDGDGADDLLIVASSMCYNEVYDPIFKEYIEVPCGSGYKAFVSFPIRNVYNVQVSGGTLPNAFDDYEYYKIIDYNGDGRSEVLLVADQTSSNATTVYNIETNGTVKTYYTNSDFDDVFRLLPGDFNGDSKTDFLVTFSGSSTSYIVISTGSLPNSSSARYYSVSSFNISDLFNQNYLTNSMYNSPVRFIISDFNNDGKDDIFTGFRKKWPVPNVPYYLVSNYFRINYSTGSGFSIWDNQMDYNTSTSTTPIGIADGFYGFYHLGDLDGDGFPEIGGTTRSSTTLPMQLYKYNQGSTSRLLTAIKDGLNNETRFTYQTLANPATGPIVYTKGSGAAYPISDIQMASTVVANVNVAVGTPQQQTLSYQYEGAKFNRQGHSMIGFSKITVQSPAQKTKKVTEQVYNSTLKTFLPKKETVTLLSNGSLVSSTEQFFTVVSQPNGRYWIRQDGTTETNGLTGAITSSSLTYNTPRPSVESGNPDVVTNTIYNGSSSIIEQTVAQYTYGGFGSWTQLVGSTAVTIANKVTQQTVTQNRLGTTAPPDVTEFTYSAQTGILTSKKEYPGTAYEVLTEYLDPDVFGNARQIKITPAGLPARTTGYEYSPTYYGLHVTKTTNPLGHFTTATYDLGTGQIASSTGVANVVSSMLHTTTYTYDEWGRLKKTANHLGATEEIVYEWAVQSASASWGAATTYRTRHKINGTDFNGTTHWYNSLSQEVRSETPLTSAAMNSTSLTDASQISVTRKEYDNRGLVSTEYSPYMLSGSPLSYTTYTYDDYTRPLTSVVTDGSNTYTTGYAYSVVSGNAKVVQTDPASRTTEVVTDPAGKVISKKDIGNNIVNYTSSFSSLGRVESVDDGTDVVSLVYYNQIGLPIEEMNPNGGTTVYTYNALGQLVSKVDANGNLHTMTYDLIGRTTQRVGPEGTTTYGYVANGGGRGEIETITGFNAGSPITTTYTYNANGTVYSKEETIDGVVYPEVYTYTTLGQLQKVAYYGAGGTTGTEFGVQYLYNTRGDVHTIRNYSGTINIWSNVSQHANGKYSSYTTAHGNIVHNTSFNGLGMATGYTTGTPAAPTSLQNLSWAYNLITGNITSRTDALVSRTENFGYDAQDQLTSWQVVGQTQYTATYANSGNISYKKDLGTYAYDPTHINAVTTITNPSGIVPSVTQQIGYTAFLQPATIAEGGYTADLTYAADYQRRKMVLKQGTSTLTTRYYLGAYEKDITSGTTRHLLNISAPDGTPVAIIERLGGTTTDTYHYLITDHLGSILRSTTNTGTVEFSRNFDPWGRERNPTTWTFTSVPTAPVWAFRGFTGHEHLGQFKLINMNGRLYDPLLGRMLSVDEEIHDEHGLYGYNAYTYAFNNPLRYTDPYGESPQLVGAIIGAVIGGVVNVVMNWNSIDNFGEGLAIFAVGALQGAYIGATGDASNMWIAASLNALVLGTNEVVRQANGDWKVSNWENVGIAMATGFVSSLAASAASTAMSNTLGKTKLDPKGILYNVYHDAVVGGAEGITAGAIESAFTYDKNAHKSFAGHVLLGAVEQGGMGVAKGAAAGFVKGVATIALNNAKHYLDERKLNVKLKTVDRMDARIASGALNEQEFERLAKLRRGYVSTFVDPILAKMESYPTRNYWTGNPVTTGTGSSGAWDGAVFVIWWNKVFHKKY